MAIPKMLREWSGLLSEQDCNMAERSDGVAGRAAIGLSERSRGGLFKLLGAQVRRQCKLCCGGHTGCLGRMSAHAIYI